MEPGELAEEVVLMVVEIGDQVEVAVLVDMQEPEELVELAQPVMAQIITALERAALVEVAVAALEAKEQGRDILPEVAAV
jgi:hypothetical protein